MFTLSSVINTVEMSRGGKGRMDRGEVEVEQGRLEGFLRAGRELGVEGLQAAAGNTRRPSSTSTKDNSPGKTDDNVTNTEEEQSSEEETVEESVN